jgi:hypothetical protein
MFDPSRPFGPEARSVLPGRGYATTSPVAALTILGILIAVLGLFAPAIW